MQAAQTGRPSIFTEALADEIIARLSEGEPLTAICRENKMPHRSTVTGWCQDLFGVGFGGGEARERFIENDAN